ncbi:MAG: pacearchaeosortase [Nanoarchaeota archaeon]
MKKESEENKLIFIQDIAIRYFLMIVFAISGFWIFYFIFTPLTVYPVYFLLSIFFKTTLLNNTINIGDLAIIEIIGACVAGSAYYLFFILNLSTPDINLDKRVKIFIISFISFLIINILRIFFLSLVLVKGYSWFDFTHKLFWYLGSTVFVLLIWFSEVKFFKIREIPFYSDLKKIYKYSSARR